MFRALTDPERLRAWWGSRDSYWVEEWHSDLRVGGAWEARCLGASGQPSRVHGVFVVMTRLHRAAALLVIVQGAGHTALGTLASFDEVSQDMVWFAGSGLAMVFLGLLSLEDLAVAPEWRRLTTAAANLLVGPDDHAPDNVR